MATIEMTITTSLQTVNIGGGVMANVETYNGGVPGPQIDLDVGDTLIVRLINDLPHPTGIHWHGIELQNAADGTPVTQNGVPGAPLQTLGNGVPAGGTYLYKFIVPRPGIFWYHPHHYHSTNRVFRGLYGMIVVKDPNEAALIGSNTIPDAASTFQLVLSDTTVCKAPGSNDAVTYVDPTTLPPADQAEWLSGATAQMGPTPESLCEVPPPAPPVHEAMNEDGSPAAASFPAGDIPNIQRSGPGRTVEGQTVLTNGVNVGGRLGTPAAPGALVGTSVLQNVQPGQGIRLQVANCCTTRYFRFRLTTDTGAQVNLIRIGGEGGLLDNAIMEGGVVGGFDTKYETGEILLPTATRADFVAVIPTTATGVLTLWTRDFQRTGGGNPGNWAMLPTVPVMHLNVTGATLPLFSIAAGTPLRAAIPDLVETLGAPTGMLLDPSTFSPPKIGQLVDIQDIQLTSGGGAGINGFSGSFSGFSPYTTTPKIASTRYAEDGDLLELTVSNTTGAHHPFHLHGFSFQPISLTRTGFPTFTWPFREFRDVLDIPSQYTLTFRVRIEDRELADGVTLGGALGRWLFHCHIFFHAHGGMISELVITKPGGDEKPNIDVNGSWAYTPNGFTAERTGTFSHPDGKAMTLSTSMGTVTDIGGGEWEWELDTSSPPVPDQITYVYVTATDVDGCVDQTVFRLKIGGLDDGSDNGDPHLRTVDGTQFDFQSVGEFVLLRDRDGMEVQTRQTPVLAANPITNPYTELRSCVSLNTAAAARVGSHSIAFQPGRRPGELEFYVDGKLRDLTTEGIDLDGHRVSGFMANGVMALRVDYLHHAVLTVTPRFWTSHSLWYLNVRVAHTHGDEGIIGAIPAGSWLPRLSSGAAFGPKPASLHDRYVQLYQTFADSWRVTDASSLFVYQSGTSTATFTDRDWPAEKLPCVLKPQFEIPGAPTPKGVSIKEAQVICKAVTEGDLLQECVFDVATLGDKIFAEGYVAAQDLRFRGSTVQVTSNKKKSQVGEKVILTATVLPMTSGRPTPKGTVTFLVDEVEIGKPVRLDDRGQAKITVTRLKEGEHKFRASYISEKDSYMPSSSPFLGHIVIG